MNLRDTRADASGLPPYVPPATRQTPRLDFTAVFRAETACHPPAHAPQSNPMAGFALSQLVPHG